MSAMSKEKSTSMSFDLCLRKNEANIGDIFLGVVEQSMQRRFQQLRRRCKH